MLVHCPSCSGPLLLQQGAENCQCRRCSKRVHVRIFPALVGKPPALPVIDPPGEGEAACFYSPDRKATCSCSHCGVLMSDAWSAQWGSDQVCLKCLDHLRSKAEDSRFETKRTLWDNVVLALALIPCTMILASFAIITAPAALILGLWHWNKPRTLVPRGRFRLVLGMLLAVLQIAGMIALVIGIINDPR
jgi:hypothetical protein